MTNSQNLNGKVTHELNYVTANRFYVEIESEITASFTECAGLGVQVDKETYFEGGINDQQRIFLKQAKFSDVTLKRGITNNLVFWNWVNQILDSNSQKERRNVNILVFNQSGETMQCWTLIGAVPVGWKAPSLQANSNTAAIEELTLAYEGLKVVNNSNSGKASTNVKRDGLGYFPSH
ncbi:phage tail protein [Allocoleopsis sp.]|uniref:phage tail protein n=1 Tax=Allocoleopsis sp. TaxID=3088169 RepID=UPI002FD60606